MPRKARVILPDTPHHIVQRGHNRNAVFIESYDYNYYLDTLNEWKQELDIEVFAWCLMTNHVHLILNPGANAQSIGLLMKRLAARQTRYINKCKRRTGTLWEGRYKASPIQTDAYLLQCCRYIELNPVRAAMVTQPEEYEWSSYRAKIGLETSGILDLDPCYLGLKSPDETYRTFVEAGISPDEYSFIRERVQRNRLTGDGTFVDEVERRTGLRIEYREPGRPARAGK
jgi:REP-associated tyrosine transposase